MAGIRAIQVTSIWTPCFRRRLSLAKAPPSTPNPAPRLPLDELRAPTPAGSPFIFTFYLAAGSDVHDSLWAAGWSARSDPAGRGGVRVRIDATSGVWSCFAGADFGLGADRMHARVNAAAEPPRQGRAHTATTTALFTFLLFLVRKRRPRFCWLRSKCRFLLLRAAEIRRRQRS